MGGWAADGDTPNQAADVHIYVYTDTVANSTTSFFSVKASQYREGVGNHSFDAFVPANVVQGTIVKIYAAVIDTADADKHLDLEGVGMVRVIDGQRMETGYEKYLPDGDYIIASAASEDKASFYYMDIPGTDVPAASDVSVTLAGAADGQAAFPSCDVWTIAYDSSSKFYSIKQKGTTVSLGNDDVGLLENAKIKTDYYHQSDTQQWAISWNGRNGYSIQSRYSGFYLDAQGGRAINGANIIQHSGNGGDNQSWMFIPYNPSQTVTEGQYYIVPESDTSKRLCIPVQNGQVANRTNVQIGDASTSSVNSVFTITKLSDGYYKIKDAQSGKVIEVFDGLSSVASVSMNEDNGSSPQRWAIEPYGSNGGYKIRVKSSGLFLDLTGNNTANGTLIQQHPWNTSNAQTWRLVPANTLTVSFNANGGTGAPSEISGKNGDSVTLPWQAPIRRAYKFVGWNTKQNGSGTTYAAAGAYTIQGNAILYAKWEAVEEVELPDDLTAINADTFLNNSALVTVVVPDGCSSIGSKAFKGCTGLKVIYIPSSVTSIASDAFDTTAISNHLIICAPEGSAAYTFASNNSNIQWLPMN